MKLSNQAQKVLDVLKNWTLSGIQTYHISHEANIPQPSVRRAIGELKVAGFTFSETRDTLGKRFYLTGTPSWALN